MFHVITYDIADDRRRNQLAKVLEGFGYRVQRSVFEAHLSSSQFEALKRAAARVIHPAEDSIRYYSLCSACTRRAEVHALGEVTPNPATIVV